MAEKAAALRGALRLRGPRTCGLTPALSAAAASALIAASSASSASRSRRASAQEPSKQSCAALSSAKAPPARPHSTPSSTSAEMRGCTAVTRLSGAREKTSSSASPPSAPEPCQSPLAASTAYESAEKRRP